MRSGKLSPKLIWLVSLYKEIAESALSPAMVQGPSKKVVICKPVKELSQKTGTFVLIFSAYRTGREKCLSSKSHGLWCCYSSLNKLRHSHYSLFLSPCLGHPLSAILPILFLCFILIISTYYHLTYNKCILHLSIYVLFSLVRV